jgi:hypothetical protein
MKKPEIINFQDILIELNGWLGSDYEIARQLNVKFGIPENYRGNIGKLRIGKLREPSYAIGQAIVYLHTKAKKQINGE